MSTGIATMDFGATPVSEASLEVYPSEVLSTSIIEAWTMGSDSTADNTAEDHQAAGAFMRLSVSNILEFASFTVNATVLCGAVTGTFKIHWVLI